MINRTSLSLTIITARPFHPMISSTEYSMIASVQKNMYLFRRFAYIFVNVSVYPMDLVITKTSNPKCRLYWCLIEFLYWRYSQSCCYFRPALWTTAPITFSLVSSPPPHPPSLCELDLQSLFGFLCKTALIGRGPSSPPPHLGSYTRALFVSQDRRHLCVTPWYTHKHVQCERGRGYGVIGGEGASYR